MDQKFIKNESLLKICPTTIKTHISPLRKSSATQIQ